MLAIRLNRTGSSKRPYFRVVVSDSKRARDSRFVEILGHYNPRSVPAVFELDHDRVAHWLKAGARPSDTVRTLLARHPEKPKETPAEPPAEAAAPPPQESEAKAEAPPAAEASPAAEGSEPAPAAPGEGEGQ